MSDWYEATKLCVGLIRKRVVRDGSNQQGNKDAHYAEHSSDPQQPHFGRVACQIGLLRHLFPMQRSRVCHGEQPIGFVKERGVKVDEETGGRQCLEESAVMAVGELGEKKYNVGSLGERRGLMEVLG